MKVSKALAVLALCMAMHSASALRQLQGDNYLRASVGGARMGMKSYSSNSNSGGGGSYGGSTASYGGNTGTYGGNTGTYGGNTGTYGGNTGTYGGNTGTYGGNTGTYGGNTGTYGGNTGTYGGSSGSYGGNYDSNTLARYAQCGGNSNRPEYGWGKCSYGDVCKCKDEWYCQCMPPNELPDHAEQRQYGYGQQGSYQQQGSNNNYGKTNNNNYGKTDNNNYGKTDNSYKQVKTGYRYGYEGDDSSRQREYGRDDSSRQREYGRHQYDDGEHRRSGYYGQILY